MWAGLSVDNVQAAVAQLSNLASKPAGAAMDSLYNFNLKSLGGFE
jgi:hypothetical protein